MNMVMNLQVGKLLNGSYSSGGFLRGIQILAYQ
jgi:hypothetical protein